MIRSIRILLAWFEPNDAASALLGFRAINPGEDLSRELALLEEKRRALARRPPYRVEGAVTVTPLPEPIATTARARLSAFVGPSLNRGKGSLDVMVIDLAPLISFQKVVSLDRPDGRIAALSPDDWSAMLDICLPPGSGEQDLSGTFDQDGRGLTITSSSPNLRLGPVQTVPMPGSPNVKLVGFPVVFGSPHVHVVHYAGRYVLKDGYHRCHALLARGVTRAPVILEHADHFSAVHPGGPSVISPEQILGDRPATLADFLDDGVSATVEQRVFRKAVRVTAQEFVINL